MELQKYIDEFTDAEFKGESIPGSIEERIRFAVDKVYEVVLVPEEIKGHRASVKTANCKFLQDWFEEYFEKKPLQRREAFDGMYLSFCFNFLNSFNNALGKKYFKTFGQVQMVTNTIFKYLYCLLPEKKQWFTYCHMPLDSYTLNWYFRQSQKGAAGETWSDLTNRRYDEIEDEILSLIENGEYSGLSALEASFIICIAEKNGDIFRNLRAALDSFTVSPALVSLLPEKQRSDMEGLVEFLESLKI